MRLSVLNDRFDQHEPTGFRGSDDQFPTGADRKAVASSQKMVATVTRLREP